MGSFRMRGWGPRRTGREAWLAASWGSASRAHCPLDTWRPLGRVVAPRDTEQLALVTPVIGPRAHVLGDGLAGLTPRPCVPWLQDPRGRHCPMTPSPVPNPNPWLIQSQPLCSSLDKHVAASGPLHELSPHLEGSLPRPLPGNAVCWTPVNRTSPPADPALLRPFLPTHSVVSDSFSFPVSTPSAK